MANIERWITVNGVHIPIMRGESKAAAVGRFIKGKSAQKIKRRFGEKMIDKYEYTEDPYYEGKKYSEMHMKEKYGKNWNKYNKHDIKGYDTDPDNKVGKANAAYRKKWESMSKYVDDANYDAELNKPASRYKLKADNYKLSKAEEKLQDFAQTSKLEYNISNIKAKELPSGAIHITTKSGKDISTINPKALTEAEKNALRKKGILK